MADYIKRSDVLRIVSARLKPCNALIGDLCNACEDVYRMVELIPSADVQPVVHGEWIDIFQREDPDTSVECRCSICEKASRRPVGKYCKWCGARMDKE